MFSVTTVSPRRSTGVAGTQLTAALNVSKTTGTGKPLQLEIATVFVFEFVFAYLCLGTGNGHLCENLLTTGILS